MLCNELRSKDLGECGTLVGVLSQPSWLFRLNDLANDPSTQFSELRPATMQDVQAWNIREMRLCMEWAKALDGFQPSAKLTSHVKSFAMSFNIHSREPQDSLHIPTGKWAFGRQIDELMRSLRELEVDLTEFALFKAILLFHQASNQANAYATLGLTPQVKLTVKNQREQFSTALFRELTSKHGLANSSERNSALLLKADRSRASCPRWKATHLMHVFDHSRIAFIFYGLRGGINSFVF